MAKEVKKKFILPIWLLILDAVYIAIVIVFNVIIRKASGASLGSQAATWLKLVAFFNSSFGKVLSAFCKVIYNKFVTIAIIVINVIAVLSRIGFNRKLDLARASKTSVVVQAPSAAAPVVTQASSSESNMNLF